MKKIIFHYVVSAALGFLLCWTVFLPKPIDTGTYELKTEIQDLKYKVELDSIKHQQDKEIIFLGHADSTQRDSIWTLHDF